MIVSYGLDLSLSDDMAAFLLMIGILLLPFFIGSFLEWRRLRMGGRAVANRVGAVRLFIDKSSEHWHQQNADTDTYSVLGHENKVRYTKKHIAVQNPKDFPPVYRRFYEFSEQMAIASGLICPILYVLPDELSINAFVAGNEPSDTVLVVTQGALERLSDEGLYGLIAHEYAHILHGDAKFNLHLMVVLGGFQFLYDWRGFFHQHQPYRRPNGYFDFVEQRGYNESQSISPFSSNITAQTAQSSVEAQARKLEAQSEFFTTKEQWIEFWRKQNRQRHQGSYASYGTPFDFRTNSLSVLGFLGMLLAQLIKYRFSREREYLADATSIQLTRSPAILETLQTIYRDKQGSRLAFTPELAGLSHFFFANAGSYFDEHLWFSNHPSLDERMKAINHREYEVFAQAIAKSHQLNMALLKEIYEQRKRGTWNELKQPDTSNDKVLDFVPSVEVVVNGRLQTLEAIDTPITISENMLRPWLSKADMDLPKDTLISFDMMKKVALPQKLKNHLYQPQSALAVIEATLLCQMSMDIKKPIDPKQSLDFQWIWLSQTIPSTKKRICLHQINEDLWQTVSSMDRRMDSAIISIALIQLKKHIDKLDLPYLNQLYQKSQSDYSYQLTKEYKKQTLQRKSIVAYQKGLQELMLQQLKMVQIATSSQQTAQHLTNSSESWSLWQGLHLYEVIVSLKSMIKESQFFENIDKIMQAYVQKQNILLNAHITSVVPTKQTAYDYCLLKLIELCLPKKTQEHMPSEVMSIRRYARLFAIDLAHMNDDELYIQWQTIQNFHSIDVLATLWEYQQLSRLNNVSLPKHQSHLSMFHTIMLNDTILSQREYDCLTLLAKQWLGKRQLVA